MYYTFGAIGVSVCSLWLLRHGRLSGVIHKWVLEAKESVTGLLIDPVKQLTLVNRRHKELMKLKQVLSTRDFRVIAIITMD
nr:protein DGS1, mitochondrial [Tanacetum cinerariifolium]